MVGIGDGWLPLKTALGGEDLGFSCGLTCPRCCVFDPFDARRCSRVFNEHLLAKFPISQVFVCMK